MFFLILIAFLLSSNKKAISWRVVIIGLTIQILLAIGILEVSFIQAIFEFTGRQFVKVITFTQEGSKFLFKSFLIDWHDIFKIEIKHIVLDTNYEHCDYKSNAIVIINQYISYFLETTSWIIEIHVWAEVSLGLMLSLCRTVIYYKSSKVINNIVRVIIVPEILK